MNERTPRTLEFYSNNSPGTEGHKIWRDFIARWVDAHPVWELAEVHWLRYVEEFMEYQGFERLSGARLSRRAEGAAQELLTRLLSEGVGCKHCATIGNRKRGRRQ
jgi:hypothetical protein